MSQLIVLTFTDTEQAGQALEALQEARRTGHATLDDAAVVIKDVSGKVEIKNQVDKGVRLGAVGGGLMGLLLGGLFFPVLGTALGIVGGALAGRSLNLGVDQKFVRDVTETLTPGSSALFVIGSSDNPAVVLGALRPFQGVIYQTTLSSDALEQLREALKSKE